MTTTSNAGDWLEVARQNLAGCSDNPGLEAQVLLAHGLARPRSWVLSHPEFALSQKQIDALSSLLDQRRQGEPLPYLIGHWAFFGLDFNVNSSVLIPRPETELLVEQALGWSAQQNRPLLAADVGAGSGCIAISLAKNNSLINFVAADISRPALQVARQNINTHGVQDRVALLQADLLKACLGPFDLVCANLPYIPTQILSGLEVSQHEPHLALDGGPDGLRLVERLLAQSASRMKPNGLLLLEIEAGQGEGAAEIGRRYFPRAGIRVMPDLAGKVRLLRIELTRIL